MLMTSHAPIAPIFFLKTGPSRFEPCTNKPDGNRGIQTSGGPTVRQTGGKKGRRGGCEPMDAPGHDGNGEETDAGHQALRQSAVPDAAGRRTMWDDG